MAKVGSALVGLCAAAALVGCGGSDDSRTEEPGEADWTLTIVSPAPGDDVSTRTMVEIAITGDAVARGEARSFDIGVFVDGQLVGQAAEGGAMVALPLGVHTLGIEGVSRDGQVLDGQVIGDEILLDIVNPFANDIVVETPAATRPVEVGEPVPDVRNGPAAGDVPIVDIGVKPPTPAL